MCNMQTFLSFCTLEIPVLGRRFQNLSWEVFLPGSNSNFLRESKSSYLKATQIFKPEIV